MGKISLNNIISKLEKSNNILKQKTNKPSIAFIGDDDELRGKEYLKDNIDYDVFNVMPENTKLDIVELIHILNQNVSYDFIFICSHGKDYYNDIIKDMDNIIHPNKRIDTSDFITKLIFSISGEYDFKNCVINLSEMLNTLPQDRVNIPVSTGDINLLCVNDNIPKQIILDFADFVVCDTDEFGDYVNRPCVNLRNDDVLKYFVAYMVNSAYMKLNWDLMKEQKWL